MPVMRYSIIPLATLRGGVGFERRDTGTSCTRAYKSARVRLTDLLGGELEELSHGSNRGDGCRQLERQ